jgi:hypothetical protein
VARHPKGETFFSRRDARSGELLLVCRFCDAEVPPKAWWGHRCPAPKEVQNSVAPPPKDC